MYTYLILYEFKYLYVSFFDCCAHDIPVFVCCAD